MNLLSIDDLSPTNIANIFVLARDTERFSTNSKLKNKIIATAFFEPSTRTKLSFQSAIIKLGGSFIDLPENSSIKKGETEEDTIRTLSEYVDGIVIRHPKDVKNLVKYSKVPIINAGDGGNEHPTQALLDLYTIIEHGVQNPLKIMFTGDLYHSRTINSLVKTIKIYSDHLPKVEFIFTNEINPTLKEYPHILIKEEDIPNYIDNVDVLYMTRPQIERYLNKDEMVSNFILTNELANKMKYDSMIMHPLPRTKELPSELDSNHRLKCFHQVKNGLHIRMAILYWMI